MTRFHFRGFSLIELSIAMAVVAILSSAIVPWAIRTAQIKAVEKTAADMMMIQQACLNYFKDHNNHWPTDIHRDLQQINNAYLDPHWAAKNPWQNDKNIRSDYKIVIINSLTYVATDIPVEWTKFLTNILPGSAVDQSSNTTVEFPLISQTTIGTIPVGSIIPWPSSNLPLGFLWCNGGTYSISVYPDLAAALGPNFMVDASTFRVPDLMGRTIVGVDGMGGVNAANRITMWGSSPAIMGGTFGEDKHQLSIAEMPRHHHSITTYTAWSAPGRVQGTSSGDQPTDAQTGDTGSDQPHNIVQPSMALGYIIKY